MTSLRDDLTQAIQARIDEAAASLLHIVWVCPTCESIYTSDVGTCGQNQPYLCRDEVVAMPEVREEAVDTALRAFNGWPASHPIGDIQRQDTTWRRMRTALIAALDPDGFARADLWKRHAEGATR